jgi:hypothetical protein
MAVAAAAADYMLQATSSTEWNATWPVLLCLSIGGSTVVVEVEVEENRERGTVRCMVQ